MPCRNRSEAILGPVFVLAEARQYMVSYRPIGQSHPQGHRGLLAFISSSNSCLRAW